MALANLPAGESGKGAKLTMANLALCFREENEEIKDRNLTAYERNEIAVAALGAQAIIRVMGKYANVIDCRVGENDIPGVYDCVFNVLEWLMEPVADFLSNYGHLAPALEETEEKETA